MLHMILCYGINFTLAAGCLIIFCITDRRKYAGSANHKSTYAVLAADSARLAGHDVQKQAVLQARTPRSFLATRLAQ